VPICTIFFHIPKDDCLVLISNIAKLPQLCLNSNNIFTHNLSVQKVNYHNYLEPLLGLGCCREVQTPKKFFKKKYMFSFFIFPFSSSFTRFTVSLFLHFFLYSFLIFLLFPISPFFSFLLISSFFL
jgi:hypothetical protein